MTNRQGKHLSAFSRTGKGIIRKYKNVLFFFHEKKTKQKGATMMRSALLQRGGSRA